MKRILVADDERPVIESIALIVKRELAGEFEVAGYAMSGREAIEKAVALAPDIVLMDVRMPGLSGLDAIREIKKRGSAAAFILVTAYERFDIAREAVELGVSDYLLKPVSKDRLAQALRNAADSIQRRGDAERREIEHREREETLRGFVETAFLHGIMLGEASGSDLAKCCAVLGIDEPLAMAAAAVFLPSPGAPRPDEELRSLHEAFRATIRYKTRALAGSLVAGRAVVLLPLREAQAAEEARESLERTLLQAHGPEMEKGRLRVGFGSARPLAEASRSWAEAMADALGAERSPGGARNDEEHPFDCDEQFLEQLAADAPERARLTLERLLEPLADMPALPAAERYRIIALFGAACRRLARRGQMEAADAHALLDLEDLRTPEGGVAFGMAVRARFERMAAMLGRAPRWSPAVSRAIAFIHDNYGRQVSLETAAYALGISPNRLSRLFSEGTGKGFSDYLIEYRIEKAKEMLLLPGASIKQVSISCGYPDPNYFSRLFKKVTGLTPTVFSSGAPEAGNGNP